MTGEAWPADALDGAPSSSTGPASPQPGQPLSSVVLALIAALDRQNELLGQIVAQNADLIGMMAQEDRADPDEHEFDLAGRRIS
jgi:hypothetical protein